MNRDQYHEAKKKINERHSEAVANADTESLAEINFLDNAYAQANNPYEVGDIIGDHEKRIRITDWRRESSYYAMPEMRFTGIMLTKSGEPRADGKCGTIMQSNIRTGVKSCH